MRTSITINAGDVTASELHNAAPQGTEPYIIVSLHEWNERHKDIVSTVMIDMGYEVAIKMRDLLTKAVTAFEAQRMEHEQITQQERTDREQAAHDLLLGPAEWDRLRSAATTTGIGVGDDDDQA